MPATGKALKIGKGRPCVKEQMSLFVLGTRLQETLKAADKLEEKASV